MQIVLALVAGVVIGIMSGLVGIGGGALLTPFLIYVYGMNQHKAQGTSLAMLLAPSGFLAFWRYYREGNADATLGILVAVGVFIGGYFGADWAQRLSEVTLRRIFASFLILIALKMFWQR
jgi:uncharacterized membrane protein YfcA